MKKREIVIRPRMSQVELQEIITIWAERHVAAVRPMGRLARPYKSKGDSMHWHISGLGRGMGTVEVTYLPSNGSLTVLVHDNRRGTWAGQAYEKLAQESGKLEEWDMFSSKRQSSGFLSVLIR